MKLPRTCSAAIRAQVAATPEPIPAGVLTAVLAAGFERPKPEHVFHESRKWRFDWAWIPERVALEREGGDFRQVTCECGRTRTVFVSRHHSRDGLAVDAEKYGEAAIRGWIVIRATPEMLKSGLATRLLLAALEVRRRDRCG